MSRVGYNVPKSRFLTCISFIYLFAFSSFYIQIPGLYGPNGISPVHLLPTNAPTDVWDFLKDPNLMRIAPFLKLDSHRALELFALLGAALSLMAGFSSLFQSTPFFLLIWLLYFSLFKVGQTFLWFQWDIMLLEAGFLAILLSRMSFFISFPQCVASDRLVMWLIRWLLFRLMFSAGVVKLLSDCPAWWGLKALHWHYQSQCIPNPMAWYFHHLPGWFHSLCVAATLAIEIIFPLLFFVPLKTVRLFSFYSQVFLQLMIIATGNFNFFNFLTIVLCYSLLKDEDFSNDRGRRWSCSNIMSILLSWSIIGCAIGASIYLFKVKMLPDYTISTTVGFTKKEFNWFVHTSLTYSIFVAPGLYFVELFLSVFCALAARNGRRRLYELFGVVVIGLIGVGILIGSTVTFSTLDPSVRSKLPPDAIQVYKHLQPYQLTNSYGLFRRDGNKDILVSNAKMTGIGGRPELILEAAPTETGPWTEYEFRFKPGSVGRIPPIVVPHQPRLDWQMWFAALSNYDHHPWLMNLIYRLLSQEREVLELLDSSKLPKNPKFIRAKLYTYYYTDSGKSRDWWRRIPKSDYLQPLSLSSGELRSKVEAAGLIGRRRQRPNDPTPVSEALTYIRQFIGQPPDLSPLVMVCLVLLITKYAFFNASNSSRVYHTNK